MQAFTANGLTLGLINPGGWELLLVLTLVLILSGAKKIPDLAKASGRVTLRASPSFGFVWLLVCSLSLCWVLLYHSLAARVYPLSQDLSAAIWWGGSTMIAPVFARTGFGSDTRT